MFNSYSILPGILKERVFTCDTVKDIMTEFLEIEDDYRESQINTFMIGNKVYLRSD